MPNVEANWYLVCDVNMDDQVKIAEKATFRLDLNGHIVTGAEDMRVYALRNGNISLAITDHSEANNGVIIARGKDLGRGAVIWVSDNGTLKMYGGTLDGSKATGVYSGTTVTVDADCAFTLYEGTIKGGNSVYLVTEKDGKEKKENGYGGAIYVSGTFDMYDGLVSGGICAETGGNIFVGKTGTFNLYGGEVSGGTAGKKGGNIAGTGKVNLYSSLVSGGSAGTYGGNIFTGKGGKLVLHEETTVITEGSAKQGGNIYLENGASISMKAGTIKEGTSAAHGGSIAVYGECEINGGQICDSNAAEQGGNIFVGKAGSLTVNGGNILNGIAGTKGGNIAGTGTIVIKDGVVSNGVADSQGGNLFVSGTVTMAGGSIQGGTAETGGDVFVNGANFTMSEGSITDGIATLDGGSVYVQRNVDSDGKVISIGSFTMQGGEISGGSSVRYGGNIFVGKECAFTLTNGNVLDGTATGADDNPETEDVNEKITSRGGNINVTGSIKIEGGLVSGGTASNGGNISVAGTFVMSGGTVKDGVVNNQNQQDRNIFADQDVEGSTFTMSGGTVVGGVRIKSTYGATVTGTANISNELGYLNLTLDDGVTISLGDLVDGAQIGINPKYTTYFATDAVEADIAYFTVDVEGKSTINLEDEDKLVLINWQEWTSESASGKLPYKAGYYYLSDHMTVSKATTMDKNVTVYLDLNGKTITASDNARVYVLDTGSVLNLTDSSANGTGRIIGNRASTAVAGMIYIKGSGAILNLYKGTLDASTVNLTDSKGLGAAVYVGLDSTSSTANATFNMHGGKIIGGTAYNGGSVYVNASSVFNMYGGEITEGTASSTGGNVYVAAGTTAGEFNLSGGMVTLGTAKQGGNVYIAAGSSSKAAGKLNVSGGTISSGTGTTTAGNVAALGVFEMTGGEIKDGICNVSGDHKYAANVYTLPGKNKCSFTMTGGTIQGYIRVNEAGTVTLGGTAKITNGSGSCGLHFSKNGATIVVSSENPFVNGAEIYLSANTMTAGTKLVSGAVADTYQSHFKLCASGNLEFKNDGIYVAE